MTRDWVDWHGQYEQPDSWLSRRLVVVQEQLRAALDREPPGEIPLVSLCAGQGRDVVPVVAAHPRREDVHARLVELDPANVRVAADGAAEAGLGGVEVVEGDASSTSAYEGAVPARIMLACGVFGNITDEAIRHTIDCLPTLCAPGATVIWTRGNRPPDRRAAVRQWFDERGFEELFFRGEPEEFGVGAHRLVRDPAPFDPGLKLFTFIR
ncbi:MAG TPA: hypothetical protein VHS03_09515 [Gaiellaceae bacterium]|nr:hypothetical protein [Gaiellaceae bacterium]